jgi:hypothetical protein
MQKNAAHECERQQLAAILRPATRADSFFDSFFLHTTKFLNCEQNNGSSSWITGSDDGLFLFNISGDKKGSSPSS